MTYRAGVSGFPGHRDTEPEITCDGCGLVRGVKKPSGMPYSWFIDGKAAPGWGMTRVDRGDIGIERRDYCPKCKEGKGNG